METYILIQTVPKEHGLVEENGSSILGKGNTVVTLGAQSRLQLVHGGRRHCYFLQFGVPG